MTANFNFFRLLKLIRKQWIENARFYLFSTLALIGILGIVFMFWLSTGGTHYREEDLNITYIISIYITGAVFASISFSMLSEKRKGIYWLGFPASHLEKLLTVMFFNVFVFTIIFSLCFLLIKMIAVAYVHSLVATQPFLYSYHLADLKNEGGFSYFIYGFFAVQAFFLLGSVYFSRFSFILTTAIGAALVFIFMLFSISLFKHGLPHGFYWDGLEVTSNRSLTRTGAGVFHKYQLPIIISSTLSFLAKFIWAPVFWLITLFRLKEKEI